MKVPQVRGMEFYPSCIEKGMRSERALKLAIAEMYVKGVPDYHHDSALQDYT
ncbi:transposase [Klebsiella pneumoniae]|uniref:transposase n=1 Tax=Klebsiella pneumoniae TaxID=573 RepID=UPI002162FA5C|nr:transposase [Klebsiella pneumoniae]UVN34369.1 transposase [Klebsiella pneumoniae]